MNVFLWDARARNGHVEATLNHPFPAQACDVGDTSAKSLTFAVNASTLEALILAKNRITQVGATALATALALQLERPELDDDRAPYAPGLRLLALSDNPRVGSGGAVALAAVLRTNGRLVRLSLDGCGVGDAGADALAHVLAEHAGNRTLTALDLARNDLSDASLNRVLDAAHAPNGKIRTLAVGVGDKWEQAEDRAAARAAEAHDLGPRKRLKYLSGRRVAGLDVVDDDNRSRRHFTAVLVDHGYGGGTSSTVALEGGGGGDVVNVVGEGFGAVDPRLLNPAPELRLVRRAAPLASLSLDGVVSSHALFTVAEGLRNGALGSLRTLEIDGGDMDCCGVQSLMSALSNKDATLARLALRGQTLRTPSARAVACCLASNASLESVDVTGAVDGVLGRAHVASGVLANAAGTLHTLVGLSLGEALADLGAGSGEIAKLSNGALLPWLRDQSARERELALAKGAIPKRSQQMMLSNATKIPFDVDELKELYRHFFCAAPPRDFDEGAPPKASTEFRGLTPAPHGDASTRQVAGGSNHKWRRVAAYPKFATAIETLLAERGEASDADTRQKVLSKVLSLLRQLRYYAMQERGDWLSRRTLVVDDSPTMRSLLKRTFENAGFSVDVACDGKEAFERMRTVRYDMVIMDLDMPVMDGLSSTASIRQWERRTSHSTPQRICAISANSATGESQGRKRVIQRRFNVGVLETISERKASTLRVRPER